MPVSKGLVAPGTADKERKMKTTFILLLMTCFFLVACDEKTKDEVRAEKAAKAQYDKNKSKK